MTTTKHALSAHDRAFREHFEAFEIAPASFDHRAHVRLAYVYLCEHGTDAACALVQRALVNFIRHHQIDPAKYHETITRAWILAVRHFMEISPAAVSAHAFIGMNPRLLDTKIMLTHYSAETLFSADARARFVDPDLSPIPTY